MEKVHLKGFVENQKRYSYIRYGSEYLKKAANQTVFLRCNILNEIGLF